jgi:heme oxygenase
VNTSLRQHLKDQLEPAHNWLENTPLIRALFSQTFEYQHYQRLLLAMKNVFCQVEQHLLTYQAEFELTGLDDFIGRNQKCARLTADLERVQQLTQEKIECPVMPGITSIRDFSAAVGALYVLEGSSQGARQIAPRLQKNLGADVPMSFYLGEGDSENAKQWEWFCQWLDQVEIDPHEAILAGVEVFVRLRQQLVEVENATA